jgi:hypothetical protein
MATKGSSSSRQSSTAQQFSAGQSYTDPASSGYFADLWREASGLAGGQMGAISDFAFPAAAQLYQEALGRIRGTEGIGAGTEAAGAALAGFRPDVMGEAQRYADPLVERLGMDIERQTGRAIGGAGGADTAAALAGSLGGGRNQVERALIEESGLNAFATGAAGIRERAQQTGLGSEQMRLQALLGSGELASAAGGLDLQGIQTALAGMPTAFNLGMSGFGAQQMPLDFLSRILGDQKVLQSNVSESTSRSSGKSSAFSFGVGG